MGSVPGGLKVDMSGGYRATIVGTLLADPLWRTHGNVGRFDYMCNTNPSCPGIVSWPDQYFAAGYTARTPLGNGNDHKNPRTHQAITGTQIQCRALLVWFRWLSP